MKLISATPVLPFVTRNLVFAEVVHAGDFVDVVFVWRNVWTASNWTQDGPELGRDGIQRIHFASAWMDGCREPDLKRVLTIKSQIKNKMKSQWIWLAFTRHPEASMVGFSQ